MSPFIPNTRQPITSHFVCLWPDHLPDEEAGRFFDATERPWSDAEARNIVFGNVSGFYFAGQSPSKQRGTLFVGFADSENVAYYCLLSRR